MYRFDKVLAVTKVGAWRGLLCCVLIIVFDKSAGNSLSCPTSTEPRPGSHVRKHRGDGYADTISFDPRSFHPLVFSLNLQPRTPTKLVEFVRFR